MAPARAVETKRLARRQAGEHIFPRENAERRERILRTCQTSTFPDRRSVAQFAWTALALAADKATRPGGRRTLVSNKTAPTDALGSVNDVKWLRALSHYCAPAA